MFLHRSSQTKVLRQRAASRCKYCGTPVDWFQKYDGMRIPLTNEFPARRIPPRIRWHVDHGIAYPGADSSDYCRIVHNAICPAVEHPDLPPAIQELVRILAVRMRTAIEKGEFTPFEEPALAEEVACPDPENVQPVRHVVAYGGILRIGPCSIDEIQCIAEVGKNQRRCKNPVCDLSEGRWERVGINEEEAKGRLGQMVLNLTGGSIWVWQLNNYNIALRWWAQLCHGHLNSTRPDLVENEFVPFHPLRHDAYVLTERPSGYDADADGSVVIHEGPPARTTCATPSCRNSSVLAHGDDWVCWQCEKLQRRRRTVHRRWVELPDTP